MVSEADHRAVADFLYREARLADEARYAEWLALWTDDGVYWVPATTEPGPDPERQLSHVYDNRARIETRVKLLQTGVRYSQEPASRMRRLVSNIEVEAADAHRPFHSGGRRSAAARIPSAASSVAPATLRIVSPQRIASSMGSVRLRTAISFVARAASGAASHSRAARWRASSIRSS